MDLEFLTKDGFIGGVIGALLGVVGTYVIGVVSERQKEKSKKEDIQNLIFTDLKRINNVVRPLGREIDNLKIAVNNGAHDASFSHVLFLSDNVFKSNSMIDYHMSFDNKSFNILMEIYEMVEALKGYNTFRYFSFYKERLDNSENKSIVNGDNTISSFIASGGRKAMIKREANDDLHVKRSYCTLITDKIEMFLKLQGKSIS